MYLTEFAPTLYREPYKILAQVFDYAVSWEYKPLNLMLGQQFGCPSGWFGRLIGHTMSWEHRPVTEWTLDLLDIQPSDHILDIGCGSGMAISLLAEAVSTGFVAGIDLSEMMVKQAIKRNAAAIQAGRVAIRTGSVLHLPYPDETFDKVCGIETFYFWPNPVACLQEVRRVLKPGGCVGLSMEFSQETLTPEENAAIAEQLGIIFFSGKEMVQLLDAAGFRQVSFEAIPERAHGWLYAQGLK